MPYRCENCDGDSFEAIRGYTEYGNERVYFDREGEIHDWGDRNETDFESDDDWEEMECCDCGSRVYWSEDEGDDGEPTPRDPTPIRATQTDNWQRRITGE